MSTTRSSTRLLIAALCILLSVAAATVGLRNPTLPPLQQAKPEEPAVPPQAQVLVRTNSMPMVRFGRNRNSGDCLPLDAVSISALARGMTDLVAAGLLTPGGSLTGLGHYVMGSSTEGYNMIHWLLKQGIGYGFRGESWAGPASVWGDITQIKGVHRDLDDQDCIEVPAIIAEMLIALGK